jgi:hypothetical protein
VTRAVAALAAAALALASCGSRGTQPGASSSQPVTVPSTGAPPPSPIHVAHQPPTTKDVIDAAIASGGAPLSVSATCTNVGTEPSDATIGRYLAGFLAEMSSPDKKNWIETTIESGKSQAGEPGSLCTLTLRHEDGDDRWGWGVRFFVRASDGLVLPRSLTCVGAG